MKFSIHFFKAAARVFDKIYNGKAGVLPLSTFFDFIKTLGEVFYSEDLGDNLRKVYPNESGSLDHFAFVRWYVDEKVSLDSIEEAGNFGGLELQCQPDGSPVRNNVWELIH